MHNIHSLDDEQLRESIYEKIDTHDALLITFACKTEIVGRKLVFVVPYSIYDDGLSNIGIS